MFKQLKTVVPSRPLALILLIEFRRIRWIEPCPKVGQLVATAAAETTSATSTPDGAS